MPITIKSAQVNYKDQYNNYVGVDVIAEKTTAEMVEAIEDAGEQYLDTLSEYDVEHIVVASDTQPTAESNRLWIDESTDEEVTIPTNEEFQEVKSAINHVIKVSNNLLLYTTFETGSISGTTGENVSNSACLRTSYIPLDNVREFDLSVADGYKYWFALIAGGSVVYGSSFTIYDTHVDIQNSYPTAQYLRVVQQKLDNTLPDKNYLTCTYKNEFIDTINDEYKRTSENKSQIAEISGLNHNLLKSATFEAGDISATTGKDVADSTRLRSSYISLNTVESFSISISDGYKYRFEMIANDEVIYTQSWTIYSFNVDIKNDYPTAQYLRIVQQKLDNTLPDKNYVTCVFSNSLYKQIDDVVHVSDNIDYFYVKDKKLICKNSPRTNSDAVAKYARVDVGANVQKVLCKFTFKGGTLALISTSLDTDNNVANITNKSIHCTFKGTSADIQLFDNGVLTTLATYSYTQLATDDTTEYECGYEIVDSTTFKTYLPNGETKTLTADVSEHNGRYFIFEEYSGGQTSASPTDNFSRPSIIAVYCKPTSGHCLRDCFQNYTDGTVPSCSPTGHVYTMFRNESSTDNIYENANGRL